MRKRREGDQRTMKDGAGQGKRLACNANGRMAKLDCATRARLEHHDKVGHRGSESRKTSIGLVPGAGLEPARCCHRGILSSI